MKAKIHISLKNGVLDPQAKAIQSTLHTLGFSSAKDVAQGRFLTIEFDHNDKARAEQEVTAMCQQLLANMVMENYHFEITE